MKKYGYKEWKKLIEHIEKTQKSNPCDKIVIDGREYEPEDKVRFGIVNIKNLLNWNALLGHKIMDELLEEFEKAFIFCEGIGFCRIGGGEWVYISLEEVETRLFDATHVETITQLGNIDEDLFKKLDIVLFYASKNNIRVKEG